MRFLPYTSKGRHCESGSEGPRGLAAAGLGSQWPGQEAEPPTPEMGSPFLSPVDALQQVTFMLMFWESYFYTKKGESQP